MAKNQTREAWITLPEPAQAAQAGFNAEHPYYFGFVPAMGRLLFSATPTRMTAEDWEPLRALGFEEETCLEVAHIVEIFNHLTRLADGFGLKLDPGTEEAARTGVPLRRPAR